MPSEEKSGSEPFGVILGFDMFYKSMINNLVTNKMNFRETTYPMHCPNVVKNGRGKSSGRVHTCSGVGALEIIIKKKQIN